VLGAAGLESLSAFGLGTPVCRANVRACRGMVLVVTLASAK